MSRLPTSEQLPAPPRLRLPLGVPEPQPGEAVDRGNGDIRIARWRIRLLAPNACNSCTGFGRLTPDRRYKMASPGPARHCEGVPRLTTRVLPRPVQTPFGWTCFEEVLLVCNCWCVPGGVAGLPRA